MAMTEPQVAPLCSISIGIKALDSQYTMYDHHMHFIMCHSTPRAVKCVELRVESDENQIKVFSELSAAQPSIQCSINSIKSGKIDVLSPTRVVSSLHTSSNAIFECNMAHSESGSHSSSIHDANPEHFHYKRTYMHGI